MIKSQLFARSRTYVMMLFPIQPISLITLVHLLLECSLAAPFLVFIVQTWRKPSFNVPKLARNFVSALNAKARTPYVCSFRIERGVSDDVCCRQNMRTLGL